MEDIPYADKTAAIYIEEDDDITLQLVVKFTQDLFDASF